MRLSAGRSTFAIKTPVAAKIGSSHSKLPGRIALRGTALSPCPNSEASSQVSWKNPRTLQPVFVPASCGYAAGPRLARRRNTSDVFRIRHRLTTRRSVRSASNHGYEMLSFHSKVAKRQLLPQLIRADDFPISVEKRDGGYPARIPGRCDSERRIPFAFPSSGPFDSGRAPGADNKRWTSLPPTHCPLLRRS